MFADAMHWFINLGSTVFIPIIIIVLGLVVRLKPSKAIIAGFTVGIGSIGVGLVTGMLADSLQPAIQAMVQRYGLSLSIMDVGCGISGPVAFSTALGAIIIPIAFGINILLVWAGMTKTLNVDVWNLWQPVFIGLLVWAGTGDFTLAIFAMIPAFLLELLLADLSQPMISKYFNLPGISITHIMALSGLVLSVPLNWLFDRIPGFRDIDFDAESIEKKFGFIGNPLVIGFIIGAVIALLAGFDTAGVLRLGIEMAAVLKLFPTMVAMFMEGLTPIAEATQKFSSAHLHGRSVNIGMDDALTVGNSSVMATCLLMIPIMLLVAVVLPGNKVLPFGDLPLLCFVFSLMVGSFRGNIFRSVIGCTLYSVTMLYLATWMAPVLTAGYQLAGYDLGTAGLVSYPLVGLWPNAIGLVSAQYFGYFGVAICAVVVLAALFYVNRVKKFNQ